jgi:hypothetical protein
VEEVITSVPWGGVAAFFSGWAVVGSVAWMLVTGRGGIALRREVEAQKQVTETFKTAWETSMSTNAALSGQVASLDGQMGDLLTYAQASERVLAALDARRILAEAEENVRKGQATT